MTAPVPARAGGWLLRPRGEAKASAGQRSGTSGPTLGKASLTWAFSAAAGLCRRNTPAGQKGLTRVATKQGQGTAWTGLAHPLARAVSDLLTRGTACDLDQFLHD